MSYSYTQASDLPVSLSAIRDHCRVYDSSFDTQLTRSWFAAALDIEKRTGLLLRPVSVRELRYGLPGVDGHVLEVGPVDLSTVVIKQDTETMTGWRVDQNMVEPTICVTDRSGWDSQKEYTIEYTAGYAMIPNDLNIAVLELCAHHFENREATTDKPLYAVPSSVWSIVQNYGRAKV
jgi:uncharacterized phiE125 gp8 family phage protein